MPHESHFPRSLAPAANQCLYLVPCQRLAPVHNVVFTAIWGNVAAHILFTDCRHWLKLIPK
ncbi:hypothetical protein OUHCRE11_41910 [Enterobacter asburiae]